MAGLVFTLSILSILTMVGFLFAWMVRLASVREPGDPKGSGASNKAFSCENTEKKS